MSDGVSIRSAVLNDAVGDYKNMDRKSQNLGGGGDAFRIDR
jgi:hypothetical protein